MTKFARKKQNASRTAPPMQLRQPAEEFDLRRDNSMLRCPSMDTPSGRPTSPVHARSNDDTVQHKPDSAPASFEQSSQQICEEKKLSQGLSPRPTDDDASTRSGPSS